ncbi:MAG TPA: DUF4287 domain-containing protein [Steroidobacteraceae bacterium]|nr:DUF4287 domain-containing protein [Steroidobacteraceae bacterium]
MQKLRVKGPASYFPSIEARYGQPMEFWFTTLERLSGMKHMEMVRHLKLKHGMGHGHANATVAAFLARERRATHGKVMPN